MSGTQVIDQQGAALGDPFGDMSFGGSADSGRGVAIPVAQPVAPAGGRADAAMASVILAQRVPVKRDMARILAEARVLGAIMGDDAFYFWETKNKDGTRGQVLGASIDCAMAALSLYGNCAIEAFPAQETDTHWVFLARFVDHEKGVAVTRSFQQRKAQNLGKRMDADRQMDIVFQIGQSKASRNAVVAGLKFLTSEMVRSARTGLLDRVAKKPEEARAAIVAKAQTYSVPLAWVEHSVGRKHDKWTAPDMAKLLAQFAAIADGSANPEDVFADPAATSDGDAAEARPEPKAQPVQQQPAEEKPQEQSPPQPQRQRRQASAPQPPADPPPPVDEPPPPGDDDGGDRNGEPALNFG